MLLSRAKGSLVIVRVEATEGRSLVSVEDQGPGLTAEDRGKLFGRFTRLSAQPTGGEKSTGLGLSIVKHMVDAMGGRILGGQRLPAPPRPGAWRNLWGERRRSLSEQVRCHGNHNCVVCHMGGDRGGQPARPPKTQ